MDGSSLFSMEFEPPDTRYVWRLWFADVLDMGTAGVLGWATLRALELERTPASLVEAGVLAWLVLSTVSGLSGWTFWRGLFGLRLENSGEPPGPMLGLVRAFTVPLDLVMSPVLQRRPLDRVLKVLPNAVPVASRRWVRGLGWQLPWLALLGVAAWFLVMPTRGEALAYLKKLDGWRCCHSKTPPSAFKCETSVSRAVREARGEDAQAREVVAACPRAAAELGR
jgi:hypothetical protein